MLCEQKSKVLWNRKGRKTLDADAKLESLIYAAFIVQLILTSFYVFRGMKIQKFLKE